MSLRKEFHRVPETEDDDMVWQCPCGSFSMFLRQSGKITCSQCDNYCGQEWDWNEDSDKPNGELVNDHR